MEKPIIFNGEMVRAILEGRKTHTRRAVKGFALNLLEEGFTPKYISDPGNSDLCRYGTVGTHLWVKETWNAIGLPIGNYLTGENVKYFYRATDPEADVSFWKPSIHMPRCASRITLEVKEIRVERLQDISEEDAKAEGIVFVDHGKNKCGNQLPGWNIESIAKKGWEHCLGTARFGFGNLWNSINEKRCYGWDVNPWVWVVSFERI